MQKLNITDGIRARIIADDIIRLVKSENNLAIYATGVDAISQTISGIDLAKRILELDNLFLTIESVPPEQTRQGAATNIGATFNIFSTTTFVEVDLFKSVVKTAI